MLVDRVEMHAGLIKGLVERENPAIDVGAQWTLFVFRDDGGGLPRWHWHNVRQVCCLESG